MENGSSDPNLAETTAPRTLSIVAPWWKHAVIYEVYVDRFAGTFANFANKLDYLKLLGIDCIHLLPHYPSPMIDDGYDVSDYKNVREGLGTLDDFKNFTEKARANGIRIMVDFVLNHTSVHHPWFKEARSSEDNPKRNFYLWSKTGSELAQAINPFANLKPKNWIFNPATRDYYFSTWYPQQADLNWDNPEVFKEMMGVIDFWVEMGVDGFRLDAASHLVKREGTTSKGLPETHAMLKKIREHLDTHERDIVMLAETHEPLETSKRYFDTGDECHLMYNFPLVEQLFLAIERGDLTIAEKAALASANIPENCAWANFLRHHDELELTTLDKEEQTELLNFLDPKAEHRFGVGTSLRLAEIFYGDIEKILKAYELLFSVPGSPIIYYGDELGMQNMPIPVTEKDTRKALRAPFDWEKAEVAIKNPDSLFSRLALLIKTWKEAQLAVPIIESAAKMAE